MNTQMLEMERGIEDNQIHHKIFEKIENTYEKAKSRTNAWEENTITGKIIDDILDIYEEVKPGNHCINVFKLDKKCNAESKFGDIAFIVRHHISKDTIIEGVAFIEAKRDFPNQNFEYSSLKKEQLEKFLKYTTQSFFCFYSHKHFFPILRSSFLEQHISLLGISHNEYSDKYIYSSVNPSSLVNQIIRFKNGYDLDYSDDALNIAKGYEVELGFPCYIMDIETFASGYPNPEPTPNNVNTKLYSTYDNPDTKYISDINPDDDDPKPNNGGMSFGM